MIIQDLNLSVKIVLMKQRDYGNIKIKIKF